RASAWRCRMERSMISGLFLAAAVAGSWISQSGFQLYLPAGHTKREKLPLLVAIHGCTQTAEDFAGLTRITKLADAQRVLVLLPNQNPKIGRASCRERV